MISISIKEKAVFVGCSPKGEFEFIQTNILNLSKFEFLE